MQQVKSQFMGAGYDGNILNSEMARYFLSGAGNGVVLSICLLPLIIITYEKYNVE